MVARLKQALVRARKLKGLVCRDLTSAVEMNKDISKTVIRARVLSYHKVRVGMNLSAEVSLMMKLESCVKKNIVKMEYLDKVVSKSLTKMMLDMYANNTMVETNVSAPVKIARKFVEQMMEISEVLKKCLETLKVNDTLNDLMRKMGELDNSLKRIMKRVDEINRILQKLEIVNNSLNVMKARVIKKAANRPEVTKMSRALHNILEKMEDLDYTMGKVLAKMNWQSNLLLIAMTNLNGPNNHWTRGTTTQDGIPMISTV